MKHPLSERETQICLLVTEGLPNKLIAQRLRISESRVRHVLHDLFLKVDVENRTELVYWAFMNRFRPVPQAKRKRKVGQI